MLGFFFFSGHEAQEEESQCFIPEIYGGYLTALIGVFVFSWPSLTS